MHQFSSYGWLALLTGEEGRGAKESWGSGTGGEEPIPWGAVMGAQLR